MIRYFIRLAAFACLTLIALPRGASAQTAQAPDAQHAAFAAGKLYNFTPDFTAWTKTMDDYYHASIEDKGEILAGHVNQLRAEFANFDPATDPLRIVTKVSMKWDPDGTDPDSTPEQRTLTLGLPEPPGMFSFVLPDIEVDVIVPELANGAVFTLSPNDYRMFVESAQRGSTKEGLVELRVLPARANVNDSGLVNNKADWPVLGSVTRVTLWDASQTQVLWEYSTPIDRDSEKSTLDSLYKR